MKPARPVRLGLRVLQVRLAPLARREPREKLARPALLARRGRRVKLERLGLLVLPV